MKVLFALFAALLLLAAVPGRAEAQPPGPARDCLLVLEVRGGTFDPAPTATTRTKCDFGGTLNVVIWNHDVETYTVAMRTFRLKAADPKTCDATASSGDAPLPKNNGTTVKEVEFPLGKYEVATRARKIKRQGANKSECYKFDLALKDKNDDDIKSFDPELEVSEPPPPPPLKEEAAPVKPKP